jgi:enediyne biosynthesis protein E4
LCNTGEVYRSNRGGVGAQVTVTAGDLVQRAERKGGASYQASHDPRLHFGLETRKLVDRIEVRWPGGGVDRIEKIAADRAIMIREGAGTPGTP